MNNDAIVNQLACLTGTTKEQVIDALNRIKYIPEVRKELDRMKK